MSVKFCFAKGNFFSPKSTYSVIVTSYEGCSDNDALTLFVDINDDIFIPNILTPNDDGINDALWVSTNADIVKIHSFEIFDRWGNRVFEKKNILPNDPTQAWDGKFRNEPLNAAVFAYRLIVELKNGEQAVRYGDVTLLR